MLEVSGLMISWYRHPLQRYSSKYASCAASPSFWQEGEGGNPREQAGKGDCLSNSGLRCENPCQTKRGQEINKHKSLHIAEDL